MVDVLVMLTAQVNDVERPTVVPMVLVMRWTRASCGAALPGRRSVLMFHRVL